MPERAWETTALVQQYLDYLADGGPPSPRDFLTSHGIAADRDTIEILALVAGPRAHEFDPGDRFGDYAISRELGRGAQGTVYLAEDQRLGRSVALKILSPHAAFGTTLGGIMRDLDSNGAARRFRREAEAASRLDHHGICTVYEAGSVNGVPFIAMRYIDGGTLAQHIARVPPRERAAVASATHLVEQVARALHVAHEAGFIHRDIKPSNIMLTAEGEPVVCDFGLAREEHGALESLTRTGEARGTPAYMSPEQLRAAADAPLDRRTDVYSLGVVLYESLTGRCPVQASSWEGLFREVLTTDPPDARRYNPSIGRDLRVVLETALEKDRNRRYATALTFADDLQCVREKRPIRARPAGPLLRARRWAQRRPAVAVTCAMLLLILVAGPWIFAVQERKANTQLRSEKAAAEREAYMASIAAADASLRGHQVAEALRQLDACPEELRNWEWRHLRHAANSSIASWPHDAPVRRVVAAGARHLITAADGLRVFELETGTCIQTIPVDELHTDSLAANQDGSRVAVADRSYRIHVWDTTSGALVRPTSG